jgi:hypothetical protein
LFAPPSPCRPHRGRFWFTRPIACLA